MIVECTAGSGLFQIIFFLVGRVYQNFASVPKQLVLVCRGEREICSKVRRVVLRGECVPGAGLNDYLLSNFSFSALCLATQYLQSFLSGETCGEMGWGQQLPAPGTILLRDSVFWQKKIRSPMLEGFFVEVFAASSFSCSDFSMLQVLTPGLLRFLWLSYMKSRQVLLESVLSTFRLDPFFLNFQKSHDFCSLCAVGAGTPLATFSWQSMQKPFLVTQRPSFWPFFWVSHFRFCTSSPASTSNLGVRYCGSVQGMFLCVEQQNMVAVSMVWKEDSGFSMPIKLYPFKLSAQTNREQRCTSHSISCEGIHRSRAKLRAARTTFSAQGNMTRLERGGRAANLMLCMYLEVAGFLMTSWMVAEGQFYLIYCDYDFLRSTSLRVWVRHWRKPLEQLFVLSFLLSITLCNLAKSYSQRSSSSDQESEPPQYSSVGRSRASSFLISLRILMKSSLSSLRQSLPLRVSSCVRISCKETSFFSLSSTSVLLLSFRLSSLIVRVLAGLLLLRRNSFAEPPLRFFMPVSTLAFAFIVGSLISNCPQRKNPCPTAKPRSIRCFSVRGRCLASLVSYNPLETQKVNAMGIFTFHSIWARAVFLLASLTVKIERRQLKIGDFCSMSLASARDLKYSCLPGGCSGPQQKSPFLEEWAWKSKQNCSAERCVRLSWVASSFRAVISGKTCLLSLWNCLFRSFPLKLVRKLPATTPSGFSMGTIWKTKLARSWELIGSSLARKRSSPQMMKEE